MEKTMDNEAAMGKDTMFPCQSVKLYVEILLHSMLMTPLRTIQSWKLSCTGDSMPPEMALAMQAKYSASRNLADDSQ